MSDYIPPELIPNILARLPVEDVLRCTSVCKSWYKLITSPSFASSHLNLSSPNQQPRVLVEHYNPKDYKTSYFIHSDSSSFDQIAELDPPQNCNSFWDIQLIDSINGMVCLSDRYVGKIILWSPSLRKSLILPKARVLSSDIRMGIVGFEFEATSNEYKVVQFSYSVSKTGQHEAHVYELGTGSWREIKLEDYSTVRLFDHQARLHGILHWTILNRLDVDKIDNLNAICSLNMKTEKFGALLLPSCLQHDFLFKPVSTFGESLSVIDFRGDKFCNIWVMKEYGVADSWEKLFTIVREHNDLKKDVPYVRHNGEFLIATLAYSLDGESCLVSYDCNTNQVKNLEFPAMGFIFSVHTYVDSLVLITALNDVKFEEESAEVSKNM